MNKAGGLVTIIIVLVIALLFGGFSLYAFGPRMEKTLPVVESVTIEKCKSTDLTVDQYMKNIKAALSKNPPDIDDALTLNKEMQSCFKDEESVTLRKFLSDFCKNAKRLDCGLYKSEGICNADVCKLGKNCEWVGSTCFGSSKNAK